MKKIKRKVREKLRLFIIWGTILLAASVIGAFFPFLRIYSVVVFLVAVNLFVQAYITWGRISDAEYKIKLIKKVLTDQGKIVQADVIERVMRREQGL